MIVKFGHYHDSMETCHDSNGITIVLNIIRSSVGRFCIRNCTIGTPCYIKELLKVRLVAIISPIGYKYMFDFQYE